MFSKICPSLIVTFPASISLLQLPGSAMVVIKLALNSVAASGRLAQPKLTDFVPAAGYPSKTHSANLILDAAALDFPAGVCAGQRCDHLTQASFRNTRGGYEILS